MAHPPLSLSPPSSSAPPRTIILQWSRRVARGNSSPRWRRADETSAMKLSLPRPPTYLPLCTPLPPSVSVSLSQCARWLYVVVGRAKNARARRAGEAGEKNRETAEGERETGAQSNGGWVVWVGWEFRVSSTPGVAAFNPPGCIREGRKGPAGVAIKNRHYFGQCFSFSVTAFKAEIIHTRRKKEDFVFEIISKHSPNNNNNYQNIFKLYHDRRR